MKTQTELLFLDKYLGRPGLDTLHQDAKEWLSDIAFWQDEVNFLTDLIKKNFVPLLATEGLSMVNHVSDELSRIKKSNLKELRELVELHEMRLSEIIRNPHAQDEEEYRKWHRHLETRIRVMTLEIRALKEQLFWAVRDILRKDLVKKLMTY